MQQCCSSTSYVSQPCPWALQQELHMQEGAEGLLCAPSITPCLAALQQWWDVLLRLVGAQCALPQVFMEELNRKQPDVEKVTKSCKQKLATELGPQVARRLATRKDPPVLHCTGRGPGCVSWCVCWLQGTAVQGRHWWSCPWCRSPRTPSRHRSCSAGSSSGSWRWTGSIGSRRPCSACGRYFGCTAAPAGAEHSMMQG